MTLHFPDVSNYQQGMSLAGMPAVIAKATEGTGYTDPYYAGYRDQAHAMGIPLAGYHYLHHFDIQAQAQLAFSVLGTGTPLMLDVEVVAGESDPTYDDVTQFVAAYRALGGIATLVYLPQWFWSGHWGSPDLRPIEQLGLALISSNYTTYSDTGPGWDPYGGVTPSIWQYTSTATINGQPNVDMNAYRGTVDELRTLFNGSPTVEGEMTQVVLFKDESGQLWRLSGDMFWRERITPTAADHMRFWSNPARNLLTDLQLVDITGGAPVQLSDPDVASALGVDVATLQGGGGGTVPHTHTVTGTTGPAQ